MEVEIKFRKIYEKSVRKLRRKPSEIMCRLHKVWYKNCITVGKRSIIFLCIIAMNRTFTIAATIAATTTVAAQNLPSTSAGALLSLFQNKPSYTMSTDILRQTPKKLHSIRFACTMLCFVALTMFLRPSAAQAQFNIIGNVIGTTSNVQLQLTGAATDMTTAIGLYAFLNKPVGTYTITPSLASYGFVPGSRTITVTNADITGVDFSAVLLVSTTTTITSFTPTFTTTGGLVTINGQGFTGASNVSFGGIPATAFTVSSDAQIVATVGTGATGSVQVVSPIGTASLAGFSFSSTGSMSGPNTPPTITAIGAQSILVGGTSVTISVVVGDAETSASVLVLNGVSSNLSLLANANIVFGGSGATRTIQLIPTPGQQGTAAVTIGVFDGALITTTTFTFSVLAPTVPTITSFSPQSAAQNSIVVITGIGFTGATAVSFGGIPAANFTISGNTQITAVIGTGATGSVVVTTPGGTVNAPGFTYLAPAPMISGFSPTAAAGGTTVRIFGDNFMSATGVSFGGIAATSIIIRSNTEIAAVVSTGATGAVQVISAAGVGTFPGFSFIPPPKVSGFDPVSAKAGSEVFVFGFGFTDAVGVSFGGSGAQTFTVLSDTQIRAIVGAGASGAVRVVTSGGSASKDGFTFIRALQVFSFAPTSAGMGDTVRVNGAGFTGATAVSFGGIPGRIVSVTDTLIVAIVAGGSSGSVGVTTPLLGTAALPGFTFTAPAVPLSISTIPNVNAIVNAAIPPIPFTISGGAPNVVPTIQTQSSFQGLLPNANITIGGAGANRTLTLVPNANQLGTVIVSVIVSSGVSSVSTSFALTISLPPQPFVTSFQPTAAGAGDRVVITGSGFTGATIVTFGDVPATQVTIDSDRQITATLGAGATGKVSVTTPGGSSSLAGFTYLVPPIINDFTPKIIVTSGIVTIVGRGFTGVTEVRFGGVPAVFTFVSDERITATVSAGASGAVVVKTPRGDTSRDGFTFIPAGRNLPPTISVIPNQIVDMNTSTGRIPFIVSDLNQPAENLTVFKSSLNTTLIPEQNIVVEGTGGVRTVTVVPAPNQLGKTTVTLTVYNGVLQSSVSFDVLVRMPMSVDANAEAKAVLQSRVYPNPASELVTVEASIEAPTKVSVKLSSVLGVTLFSATDDAQGGIYRKTVDVSGLASGVYFVEISDGKRRVVEKLVKP